MNIAIIGAGAAGCFAAANIDIKKHYVQLFEKTHRALQKVRISGGGRCNLTHHCFDVDTLTKSYPRGARLMRKTLYRFGPADTIEWFNSRGVATYAEKDGRVFPASNSSQSIVDCLLKPIHRHIQYQKELIELTHKDQQFKLLFSDHTSFVADKVLIASGGFQKPSQYKWLQALGHSFENPVPSLFTFHIQQSELTHLKGISIPQVTLRMAGTSIMQSGPILITHQGLSGPSVLRLSAWAARESHQRNYHFDILINWLGDATETDVRNILKANRQSSGKQQVSHHNPFQLPRRFWDYILHAIDMPPATKWGEMPALHQNRMVEKLIRDVYSVAGKNTFKEEFVTCGGIKIKEIDPESMQSRIIKGLFFAGEIMDVDGLTGGFNFQHAWSSGWIAAQGIQYTP